MRIISLLIFVLVLKDGYTQNWVFDKAGLALGRASGYNQNY